MKASERCANEPCLRRSEPTRRRSGTAARLVTVALGLLSATACSSTADNGDGDGAASSAGTSGAAGTVGGTSGAGGSTPPMTGGSSAGGSASGVGGTGAGAAGAPTGGTSGADGVGGVGAVSGFGGDAGHAGAIGGAGIGGAAAGAGVGGATGVGGAAGGATGTTGGQGGKGGGQTTGGTAGRAQGGTGGSAGKGGNAGNAGSAGEGSGGGGGNPTYPGCSVQPPTGSPVATHGALRVVGNRIQNRSGSVVQLKGVSSYWLNWATRRNAESRPALQYARDNWKLTVLRAAMGVEESGGYTSNAAAMQTKIDTIVENALALGVYVIVDFHSHNATDYQSQAITFFNGVAQKYGACPNVIYEDYNEPTGRTWAQIKPYHQAVVNAIRARDADNLIILGTPNWSQDVDIAAQSPVSGANLAYTLHFYACSHGSGLRNKGNAALAAGVPLFVTEFGATPANGGVVPNNTVCEAETNTWFTWMAQNGVGGAAWKLNSGTDSSNILTSSAPVDGPWTDTYLTRSTGASPGHGLFVVNWMRQ